MAGGRLRDWNTKGTRAAQPAATAVDEGYLYYVSDEDLLERSNGTTWDTLGSAAAAVSTHEAAGDPHAGYRLESGDHTHASTGAQAGQLDHGAALTPASLADDDHPQYIKDAEFTQAGSVLLGTGAGTFTQLLHKFDATVAPTANDDSGDGYAVGSIWIDTTGDKIYICYDATLTAALWQEVGAAAPGGGDNSLNVVASVTGATNVDRDDGATHDLTLTGNATLTPIATTVTPGDSIDMRWLIRQDGIGGHTLAIAGTITWVGGSAPTMPTAANAMLTVGLVSVDDATTWLGYFDQTGSGSGDVATDAIWDAKGDLAGGTGADTATRLAVGANDTVLTADSAEATGMKWATPAAGSSAFVGALVYNGAAQSIPHGTNTALAFSAEDIDTDAFHDTATNNERFTIPAGKAGKYRVTAQGRWATNATGSRVLRLIKNAATSVYDDYMEGSATTETHKLIVPVIVLAEADYIWVQAFQTSGGDLAIGHASARFVQMEFSLEYLGA